MLVSTRKKTLRGYLLMEKGEPVVRVIEALFGISSVS
jgi:hypothetical protein